MSMWECEQCGNPFCTGHAAAPTGERRMGGVSEALFNAAYAYVAQPDADHQAALAAALEAAAPAEGAQSEAEYEVWQDDPHDFAPLCVAGVSGPRDQAFAEALHYATQYQADGPVRIQEITRRDVTPESFRAIQAEGVQRGE